MKKPAPSGKSNAPVLITKYIDELGDWRTATLTRLREVILSAGPDLREAWKWGHPVWEANGLVCVAGAFGGYVKLTFSKGASLRDPRRLFNAGLEGKAWRVSISIKATRSMLRGSKRWSETPRPSMPSASGGECPQLLLIGTAQHL